MTGTTVTTSGLDAYGVQTNNNGTTKFTGGSIATTGNSSLALDSSNGSSVTVGLDALGAATKISTAGLSSAAVQADSGGAVSLTGATVSTTGNGSTAVVVVDAGSSLTATNVTVSAQGATDPNTTYHANAIYNGPGSGGTSGGTLTLNNVTSTAAGLQTNGVLTQAGGTTTITGGSFTVNGQDSAAAQVDTTGNMTISGSNLSATADGSTALVLHGGGGSITASNLTIKVSGAVYSANGDHAVGVVNGDYGSYSGGGTLSITDSSVATSGYQSHAS